MLLVRFLFHVYPRLILWPVLSFNSRQSIKKYVMANNKISVASQNAFDAQFNKAIKVGVEKGEFIQPKGMYNGSLPSRFYSFHVFAPLIHEHDFHAESCLPLQLSPFSVSLTHLLSRAFRTREVGQKGADEAYCQGTCCSVFL